MESAINAMVYENVEIGDDAMRTLASALIASSFLNMGNSSLVQSIETLPVKVETATNPATNGLKWHFNYDEAGRLTKLVDPAGKETKIHYKLDEHGRIQRLTKELSDTSQVTLEFDRFGRRVSMTDAAGTVRYDYDGFGHLTAVRRDGAPSLSYTYDTMDRLMSVDVGGGLTTKYSYDFLGRLAKIDTPAGSIIYEYQTGQGKTVRTLPKGIRTIWEYQPDNSPQSISHAAADDHILAQFTYSYRPDGLISSVKEWSPQGEKLLSYAYDTSQRLTTVTDSEKGTVTYRYDQVGNRTETTTSGEQGISATYDWAGRMLRYNGQDTVYDAAGNLTRYAENRAHSRLPTPQNIF